MNRLSVLFALLFAASSIPGVAMGSRVGNALGDDSARESFKPRVERKSNSQTPFKVPEISYLGMGYDIFRGNPLEVEQGRADPGWQRLVYNLTYLPGQVTPDGQILQPDNTEIKIEDVCETSFVSDSIFGGSSYQRVAGKGVSASAGFSLRGFGAKFGASKVYKSVSGSISTFGSVYISTSAECRHYNAQLLDTSSPSLHNDFLSALYMLPEDYNNYTASLFHNFFQDFGTHVVKQVSLGGKYGQVSNFTSSTFAEFEMESKEKGWGAGASFAAMISAGVEGMSQSEHAEGEYFISKSQFQFKYISGGEFPKDNLVATWEKSVAAQPMPVQFELTPIHEVHESRREPLTAALSDYCEFLKQGGMLTSCENPVDPPPPPPKKACHMQFIPDYNHDGQHFDDGWPYGYQINTHTSITEVDAQCGSVVNRVGPLTLTNGVDTFRRDQHGGSGGETHQDLIQLKSDGINHDLINRVQLQYGHKLNHFVLDSDGPTPSWQCGKSDGGGSVTLDFATWANRCMGRDVSGGKPRLVGFNGYNTNKVVNSLGFNVMFIVDANVQCRHCTITLNRGSGIAKTANATMMLEAKILEEN